MSGTGKNKGERRAGQVLHVLAFTLGAASAVVGVAGACLPDLPPFPAVDAASNLEPQTTPGACGDGIIATLDDGGDAGEQCDPGGQAAAGCSACQISCEDGGVIGPSGHCYFLAGPSAEYKAAVAGCFSASAHVVTIDSDDEALLVRGLVQAGTSYRVGLFLNDQAGGFTPPIEEPGWPASDDHCPGCYARGADDAGVFAVAIPTTQNVCLVADPNDHWRQIPCDPVDAGFATVCEREPIGQRSTACGGPLCTTLPQTAGQKRYVISLDPATASEAAQFCASFDGGALVALDSNQEREQLTRELRMLFPSEHSDLVDVWIGLTHTANGWAWDNGSDASPPWAENEPSPNGAGRAFLRFDNGAFDTKLAKTDDGDASAQRVFVCQRR